MNVNGLSGLNELLNELLSLLSMQHFLQNQVSIPLIQPIIDLLLSMPFVGYLVALILWKPMFALLIFPGLGTLMAVLLFIIWFERKLTARIQWRKGPVEILRQAGGVIQALADGMRYFFQEVIVHRDAHKPYFLQFPILIFIPVLLPLLFIPAGSIVGIESPYSLAIAVALISLIPVFIVAIGWASNSRYAYIGTIREAFMYFAYEIPFILAVISMILLYGTADMVEIVEKQNIPGIFLNPVAAFIFFLTTVMATSRLPFEIPEADQEIAFGPFVEYSGIMFGLVMTITYEKMYILALLMSVLFLGGGNGPDIPLLGNLSGVLWLFVKAMAIMVLLSFLRSIYARLRLDQALRLSWNTLMKISLLSLAIGIVANIAFGLGW
ncbi:MAG: NADH-quinone oxidoreductase subunit NuoH [Archaeoglobus sp.]|nr:NADH-quinone oxidoreductase subunit NuoH [Archaeoglobus sp.]